MSRYINQELRQQVAARAGYACEYCLIHEDDTYLGCEVDHIISIKHGGPTEAENLSNACMVCNRNKGSDLGSLAKDTGQLVRFYNPRIDVWSDHFKLEGAIISPLTEIGEVTVRIFRFNDEERMIERQTLLGSGRYPLGNNSSTN